MSVSRSQSSDLITLQLHSRHVDTQPLQSLLDQLTADGIERGLQLCVHHHGRRVIDLHAGTLDAQGTPVTGDTLFPIFSVTKGIASTVVHRLVERGLLAYEAPIATYWPAFAGNGKQDITLAHAMNHTAGLAKLPAGLPASDVASWSTMVKHLEQMPPEYPPGKTVEYHAVSFSWAVCEVACRVTGLPFGELVQREVCQPLELSHLFVGLPSEHSDAVAVLEEQFVNGPPGSADDGTPQAVPFTLMPLHAWMNKPAAQQACVPASNGIMNARDIAAHYAALVGDGLLEDGLLAGTRLLSPETIERAITLPAGVADTKFALGYARDLGWPGTFGHGGYGGSMGFADPALGLAVGLTRNRFSPQGGHERILAEVRRAFSE